MVMNKTTYNIPYYANTFFRFFSDLVRIINKDGNNFITSEQIEPLIERDGVPFDNILKSRMINEIDDVYEIDQRVADFIAFSNNNFALTSPESVKKFHHSLLGLYEKLLRTTEVNDIVRYSHQLISELNGFAGTLDESISRLLQDTLEIKENIDEVSARERFDRATEIIDEYVTPLQELVEDKPNTVLPLVRNISSLAMQKSGAFDKNMESLMRRLRLKADSVHKSTEVFGKQIIGELFTLKKIKKSSASLSGAIAWLENMSTLEPSGICSKFKITTHSEEFFFEAIEELEWLLEAEEEVFVPTGDELSEITSKKYYHFNRQQYLKRLQDALPIENIYLWLHDELRETDELTYGNYCKTLSVIDDLSVSYSSERMKIPFEGFSLNVPMAKASNIRKRKN